jgi:hypothetical protein
MTRDDFATLVTHELRNTLNAMSGWVQLLQLDATPRGDAARQGLAGLRSAVDHQLAQVEALGGVLRMAGGRRPAARAPVALDALLRDVADALGGADGAAPARSVRLRLRLDAAGTGPAGRGPDAETVPATCVLPLPGDPAMLRAALVALGAFALRQGVPGATLDLALSAGGAGGPGEPEGTQEPGEPGESGESGESGGSGGSGEARIVLSIDAGGPDGPSIWHGFAAPGTRLSLELLHAALVIEAHGGRLVAAGDRRRGDALEIRFGGGAEVPRAAPSA